MIRSSATEPSSSGCKVFLAETFAQSDESFPRRIISDDKNITPAAGGQQVVADGDSSGKTARQEHVVMGVGENLRSVDGLSSLAPFNKSHYALNDRDFIYALKRRSLASAAMAYFGNDMHTIFHRPFSRASIANMAL